jgi:hypothetical protein
VNAARDLRPGDLVRCGDRDNWGTVVSVPKGGTAVIRWRSADGSVAEKAKPVGVVTEVKRCGEANRPAPQEEGGRALKALARLRRRLAASGRQPRRAGAEARPAEVWPRGAAVGEGAGERPPAPAKPDEGTLERLARIRARSRSREPRRTPCWACRGTRFWLSTCGVVVCATCHPPARPEYAERWMEIGEE